MNIQSDTSININNADKTNNSNQANLSQNSSGLKFSDELKNAKDQHCTDNKDTKNKEVSKDKLVDNENNKSEYSEFNKAKEDLNDTLNDVIDKFNGVNRKEDIFADTVKQKEVIDDKYTKSKIDDKNQEEDFILIDNNMNISDKQDKLEFQMGSDMSFNSNGQPFTEFVNQQNSNNQILKSTDKELAEEKAILSTMEENIAIANKNMAIAKTKLVENEHGVQKVDKKSNLVVDTIVSYDKVVMDKADVEFFVNLVDGMKDIHEVTGTEKSARVSKTLADLLLKSMNENKPVRIDFDNDISVIIKIDRAGKISADFLPSSQIAEAYLKENLPLLKQRFDDNNIDYNELNQRQRNKDSQDNKKKEQKNE